MIQIANMQQYAIILVMQAGYITGGVNRPSGCFKSEFYN